MYSKMYGTKDRRILQVYEVEENSNEKTIPSIS